LRFHLEEGAVGGSEPGIDGALRARLRRRRLRAVAAGAVAFAVVVAGGLIAVSGPGPGDDLASSPTGTPRAPSPSASATAPPIRLGPPKHLKVHRGVTSVTLVWDPPAAGARSVQRYEVFRNGKRLARPTRAKFRVTGLRFGTQYRFWVVAVGEDDRASPRALRSVTTKLPPIAAARLVGTFSTTATLTSSAGERVRFSSHTISWSLSPTCPASACTVSFTATHRFGPRSVVTSGVLDWSGTADYTGRWIGAFGTTCRNHRQHAVSTLMIKMRATSAHVVGGAWVATGISGTIRESVEGCGGTPAAIYDF
jgi:chitodextrinase